MEKSKELIYGLNDRPPLRETLFAALQHLLAIFVAIITPPLIISSALKFDLETTGFLVSMSLFVSGLATFVQCRRFGPVGTGLLCIQGTSFSFISPIIGAGLLGVVGGKMDVGLGLSYIFGACMVASVVEMVVSRLLPYTRKIITPLVSGIVVSLIGMCLIKAGITSCGGGQSAVDGGTFGSLQNLGLALLVLVSIIFFNRSSNRFLRMGSIVLGLLIGCVAAYALHLIDFSRISGVGSLNIPVPFKYGLHFDVGSIIGLGLIYLVTAVEAFGDITANSLISGEPVEGPVFLKRAQGGVLADGFNSFLAAVFNSFPNSIFAQNNGMIQLTGVASRYVGYFPGCRPAFLAHPRCGAGRSDAADVRYGRSSRYPYHCRNGDNTQGGSRHGHQFCHGPERGVSARHPRQDARCHSEHLFKRYYHRRSYSHPCQCVYPHQGIGTLS